MSTLRIEHVNVSVRDPAATAKLLEAIFGWHIRWQGPARDDGHTIHIGSTSSYIALYTDPAMHYKDDDFAKGRPLNHIGVEVEDLDAVEACVASVGLIPFNHDDYAPGKRFYFFDPDGIEYEVISYG